MNDMRNLIEMVEEGMSDPRTRAEKIEMGTYDNGLKLIYGWVKDGTINLKEFAHLIEVNRDSIY